MPTFFGKMCVCRSEDVGGLGQIWNTPSPSFFSKNKVLLSNNNNNNNNNLIIIIIIQKVGYQVGYQDHKVGAHLVTNFMHRVMT